MPAAYCSVMGLKPTVGLVSIRGIIPCVYSLDHCGPMTKTVEDAAITLNGLAGYDKLDNASVEHPSEDYVESMKQSISGLRLGIPALLSSILWMMKPVRLWKMQFGCCPN
jgi:aspartyl-tRNA(Asn)/glutamyl-tRNA(Gln) amidotransferase subunit A